MKSGPRAGRAGFSSAPRSLLNSNQRYASTMTSLISAVSWIPRGAAAVHPTKYVIDDAELERVGQLARVRLEDAKMELELAQAGEGDGQGDEGDAEAEWEE